MTEPIPCPDCSFSTSDRDAFTQHREEEHPPSLRTVSGVGGIESGERFGTDPEE